MILIGNKRDLGNRQVTESEISSIVNEHGVSYMEISAKSGENVDKPML